VQNSKFFKYSFQYTTENLMVLNQTKSKPKTF